MSIFLRRRKFRNLVSSAISTVVLSSCASQVAQCWPSFVVFDPDRNSICLDFVRAGDGRISWWVQNFYITKDSVVSFGRMPKDDALTNYWQFSSSEEKRKDVEKLISLLIAYFEGCFKLYGKIKELENFEEPHDMCLLRSSGRFWTSKGFFDLLNLKSDAAKKVYSSLKPEYKELIHSLRKQSDKIVKLYNSLSYKVSNMFIDNSQRRLWVIADKPENVYVDENIKKILPIGYFSLVNRNQMSEYVDEDDETSDDSAMAFEERISDSSQISVKDQKIALFVCSKMFSQRGIFREISDKDVNDKDVNEDKKIDESCKPEDEWDWSWPKSGELIELDRYTDLRLDPNFYLDN